MAPSRPHVTYVIDDLGHGGAQRQLYYCLRALSGAADLSVVVLSNVADPYGQRIRELGVPVHEVQRRGSLEAGRLLSLANLFRSLGTNIAHAMLDASDAYTFMAARSRRIPVVLSLRSDRLHHHHHGAKGRMLGWMMRRAEAVTVNSNAGRDYLLNRIGVPADRVELVANIVEIPAEAPPIPSGPPVIGAVGRLVALKRFDSVIDALSAVRRAVPDARLAVVGDGPARHGLENLARREDVAGAVEFLGSVPDAAVHIGTFACLVVASTHEGLPNTALEALARGVPVVAVRAGDLPRIIQDGVTGVLTDDASAEGLADAIVRALSSRTLRESSRREGPQFVRQQFSAEQARERLLAVYARIQP